MILAHLDVSLASSYWIVAAVASFLGLILGGWLTTSSLADVQHRADRLRSALRIIATLDEGPAKTAAENALRADQEHA